MSPTPPAKSFHPEKNTTGPYNIYVFPIDVAGVLGTSFDVALARARGETGVRFTNANWTRNRSLPVMPVIRGGTITINTNGLGRADWLERQRAMAGSNGRMIKAGFFPQGENQNGAYGGDGDWGVEGAQGTTGSQGSTGANGTCGSTSSVTGVVGGNGNQGGNGQPGESAETKLEMNGGDGGNAGIINFPIPANPTTNFIFTAMGGDGGIGGTGGRGGKGRTGGKEVPGDREPTAIVTRAVLEPVARVAQVVQAVKGDPAVRAAREEKAATAPTLPSATQTVKGLTTSLPIRGAVRVALVLRVDSLEQQETADRAAMAV